MHAACGHVWSYSSKQIRSLSVCYVQVWLTMGCLAISLLTQLFSSSSGVRGHAIFARLCKDPLPLVCCNILQGLWRSRPEHWRLHDPQAEQDYSAEEEYADEDDAWANSSWGPSLVFCLAPLLILGGILMSTFLKHVIS